MSQVSLNSSREQAGSADREAGLVFCPHFFYNGPIHTNGGMHTMSEKNQVQVLLGGKVLTVSGYESEEYLEKVASYLNHKIGEFSSVKGYRQMAGETKETLLALNVADDYFKAREKVEDLEAELDRKDQELLSLRQELVSLQVMRENMKKQDSGTKGSLSARQNGPRR